MKIIYCQVKMINNAKVNVTIEDDTPPALIIKAVEEQVSHEFGVYDKIEIDFIESVMQLETAAK